VRPSHKKTRVSTGESVISESDASSGYVSNATSIARDFISYLVHGRLTDKRDLVLLWGKIGIVSTLLDQKRGALYYRNYVEAARSRSAKPFFRTLHEGCASDAPRQVQRIARPFDDPEYASVA